MVREKPMYVSSCLFQLTPGEEHLRPYVSMGNTCYPRDPYLNPLECYPLTPRDLTEEPVSEYYMGIIIQALRTFHDCLHIAHKTMHHTQRLCNAYPSFILG